MLKAQFNFYFSESVSAAVVITVERDLDHSGGKGSTKNTRSTEISFREIIKSTVLLVTKLSTTRAEIVTFHWKYKTQDKLGAQLSNLTKSLLPLTHNMS